MCLVAGLAQAQPTITNTTIGTAFRYQGAVRGVFPNTAFPDALNQNGVLQFEFGLWNDPVDTNASSRLASNILTTLTVSNGFFSTLLDFGNVFNGQRAFLEVSVYAPSNTFLASSNWITISPRSEIGAVPYALWAQKGGTKILVAPPFAAYTHDYDRSITNLVEFDVVGTRTELESARLLPLYKYTANNGAPCLSCYTILTLEVWRMTNTVTSRPTYYEEDYASQFVRTLSAPLNLDLANTVIGQWISMPITNVVRSIQPGEMLKLRSRTGSSAGPSAGGYISLRAEAVVREIP